MKIIKFNKIKKNEYEVYIDGYTNPLILNDDTILHFNLLTTKQVAKAEIRKILEYNNLIDCYHSAISYLSIKLRCKNQLYQYLKKYYDDALIHLVILRLEKEKYIDDEKYIEAYINDQVNLTLNGPDKIKQSLLKLDLNENFIDIYLENVKTSIWEEKVIKIINKRIAVNKTSKKYFILKTTKYLQNMGYNKNIFYIILNDVQIDDNLYIEREGNIILRKLEKKYSDEKLYLNLKKELYAKGYNLDTINQFILKIKEDFN